MSRYQPKPPEDTSKMSPAEKAKSFKHSPDYDPEDFEKADAETLLEWFDDVESMGDVGKEDGGIDLSEWEQAFMETVTRQVRIWRAQKERTSKDPPYKPMTIRQAACLKKIWDRVE